MFVLDPRGVYVREMGGERVGVGEDLHGVVVAGWLTLDKLLSI
jgi:hypothetical protein